MENNRPNLSKFFLDPDFHYILDMLSQNTEHITDICTIDLSQSAETIKAIIAGRQETLKLIENFKQDIKTYTSKISKENNTQSFK